MGASEEALAPIRAIYERNCKCPIMVGLRPKRFIVLKDAALSYIQEIRFALIARLLKQLLNGRRNEY